MKHTMGVLAAFLMLTATTLIAQSSAPQAERDSRSRADAGDVTYGKIKELTAGEKVVINVDNAPDKTFDIASTDVTVKLDAGLKVGDSVKVTERTEAGKTKTVTIAKATGGGAKRNP